MAKIKSWEDDLSIMTDIDLEKIKEALDTLKHWSMFEREYDSLSHLRLLVGHESTQRMMDSCH